MTLNDLFNLTSEKIIIMGNYDATLIIDPGWPELIAPNVLARTVRKIDILNGCIRVWLNGEDKNDD